MPCLVEGNALKNHQALVTISFMTSGVCGLEVNPKSKVQGGKYVIHYATIPVQ